MSREKRSAKSVVENDIGNEKVTLGTKWSKGRTHFGCVLLEELVFRNGIEPFMNKLPAGTVEMCNEVLEMDPSTVGKRKNEDHLCPPQYRERIENIVNSLIVEKKVTRSDISLFSRALTLGDSLLTAALRS